MTDTKGFIVGKPATIFDGFDGKFPHAVNAEPVYDSNNNLTSYDAFSSAFTYASPIDDVYNYLADNEPEFARNPNYNSFEDKRLNSCRVADDHIVVEY